MDDNHPLLQRADAAIDALRAVDQLLPRRHRDVGHALLEEAISAIKGLAAALSESDGPAV